MSQSKVKVFRIKQLWELCRDGIFAVPEIQREFVWDAKRIYRLLDSVYRGLPIGSLLVWPAKADNRHFLRHAQEVLPPHDSHNGQIWFLLDGQQRLSVLYRAKEGHQVQNSNGKVLDFSKLCFSFDPRFESRFVFIRKPVPHLHVPVPGLLGDDWQRRIRHLPQRKKAEVRRCRRVLMDYEVPLIYVGARKLEEIREAFLRINSGGLRISSADRAFTRASRLDLRRLMKELRAALPHGFDSLDMATLQSAMALIGGQKELGAAAVDSAISKLEREVIDKGRVSKRFTRRWRDIGRCIEKAVDYVVTELGVPNPSYLPSQNMISVLAYFFHVNQHRQPNTKQRKELRKWFWATGVGRRYAGRGFYPNIRGDLKFFENLSKPKPASFLFHDAVYQDEIRRSDYQVGGSLNTAFHLLLLHTKPRYIESGNTIPIDKTASIANRKDKHHIFPKALLARNGFSAREANSLCNICYIVAEENQSIGSKKPIEYLEDHRRKRYFASVMKSHLIPHKSDSGLLEKNVRRCYRVFQKKRLEALSQAFEKAAGIRLFRRKE
jgi:hypothetical protein